MILYYTPKLLVENTAQLLIEGQFENRQIKKIYINEDKLMLLAEGKDRKQQARAKTKKVIIEYFNDRLNVNEPNEHTNGLPLVDFLEQEVMHDFFHSRSRQDAKGKFICLEPMVARIILNAGWKQDQLDGCVISRLQNILNYIEELYLQGQIDPQTDIPLDSTIDSLNETFGTAIDEREASEAEARKGKEFTVNKNYVILDDVSYEQAHEIGNYSYSGFRLCYTKSKDTWLYDFDGENNKVYVCLRKGWIGIKEKHGNSLLKKYPDANAYDEYGLSMIFIFVDPEGRLVYSNTRWNHQATYGYGRSDDHAFTKDDISDLIGVNFDERFVGYTVEELKAKGIKYVTYKMAEQMLSQGVDPSKIFNSIYPLDNGWTVVRHNRKVNILDKNNHFLSKQWFDDISIINNRISVKLNGKDNLLKEDGTFLWNRPINEWFNYIDDFRNGYARVKLNKKWNFLKEDGTLLWNQPIEQWFDDVDDFRNGYARVKLNKKWNFLKEDGTLLWNQPIEQWFDRVSEFDNGLAIVKLKRKWYYLKDGQLYDASRNPLYGSHPYVTENRRIY